MAERVIELQDDQDAPSASSSAPSLPPRPGKRSSRLWEPFDRDPPLGQPGPHSTNPSECKSCKGPKFFPKGSAGLMAHLMICKKLPKEKLAAAQAIAADEGITYEGKPDQLASYVENSRSASGRKRQRSDSGKGLHSHFDTRKPSQEETQRISRALLLFVVMCNVSFEAVASPFFIFFLQQLRPLYHPPSK